MRTTRLIVALAVSSAVACLGTSEARAESEALVAAYRAYQSALEAEDPAAALPHAERALELGRAEYGETHAKTAILLVNLGALYEDLRRLEDAVQTYSHAIRIRQRDDSGPPSDLIDALFRRANALARLGHHSKARTDYLRAVHIIEETVGAGTPSVADALVVFGTFEERGHEYRAARRLYQRSIKIREASLSPDDPKIGMAHFRLANLYMGVRKYTLAERQYTRALGIFEKTLPADHISIVAAHEHLVALYGKLGRMQDMETHLLAAAVVDETDAEIQPLYRVAPKYPTTFGDEGSAIVAFTVSALGAVEDAHFLESNVPRRFERAILDAMTKWRYRPKVVDGQRVPRPGVEIRFEFVMQKAGGPRTGSHISGYH